MNIHFGTDGWRGRIAQEFTFDNLELVAQATAEQFQADNLSNTEPLIFVGHDRRFLGEDFAACVAEIMAANGFKVKLYDIDIPTPMVSYDCFYYKARGGVIITASHNPPEFTGFKVKLPFGGSAHPSYTSQIESRFGKTKPHRLPLKEAIAKGIVEYIKPSEAYLKRLPEIVDLQSLRSQNIEIVVDSMHGSGGHYIENFLKGGNLRISTIRGNRDVYFGGVHPEPMMPQLQPLVDEVRKRNAFLGLSTDGDADRVGAVDDNGNYISTHRMLAILALYLIRKRNLTGAIVSTVSQSVVSKRIAASYGLKFYEVPVGFKHICELMLTEDVLCGGEESNGLGCKLHIPERDGILNALLFLEAIIAFGKKPSELILDIQKEFGAFEYDRIDVKVDHLEQTEQVLSKLTSDTPNTVAGFNVVDVVTLDGVKLVLQDDSWLLFRKSGTEPLLRVYSEATSKEKLNKLLEFGKQFVYDTI